MSMFWMGAMCFSNPYYVHPNYPIFLTEYTK